MKQLYELAEFVCNMSFDHLPEQVVEAAKYCMIDNISAALGGSDDSMMESVIQTFLSYDGNGNDAYLWGHKKRVPMRTAAFLNGMMGHVLELDDVHTDSKAHIGTVVIPAAWAMGNRLGSDGKRMIEAILCGYEVMARIGKGFGVVSHRSKGWHVTSTAGTFGAAAACAKLLQLDVNQTVSAFGLAGTQSFGTWAFLPDGATNKILHPGKAALNGMDAAILAKAGMKGPSHILDSVDGGIYPAMSDDFHYEYVAQKLGTRYEILYVDKKTYPCCRSTHCAIDGAIDLCEKYGIEPDQIERVLIKTYQVGYRQCGSDGPSQNPQKPTEAKFSTPYTVACAIINHNVTLNDFLPDRLMDKKIRTLMHKIKVEPEEKYTERYPDHWGCKISICCKNQKEFSVEVPDASGSVDFPLSKLQMWKKSDSILSGKSTFLSENIRKQFMMLEKQPVLPVI
ncbi:MAG: MmgE/PrpD family protein [Lachnospiraceae bacterium]|nr:MmgE/PrpD family protein [Lachnospiraceae bacterium]